MPIQSKKLDLNQLAKSILNQSTGETKKVLHGDQLTGRQAAGRKGGLLGGKKRMESITPEQRKDLTEKVKQARLEKEALASSEASANGHQLNRVN